MRHGQGPMMMTNDNLRELCNLTNTLQDFLLNQRATVMPPAPA